MRGAGPITVTSSWVCVCVCLSGQDKLLRLLTPAGYGAYIPFLYDKINAIRFKTCGFH